ncbi:SanA/YdcF family protein [Streptomyces marincola]|uniref:SanA/YdcF family protein n=1 Tax=Streptomyces marincola TaxID=2878388 RepID=UPI001CF598D1|nr:ElyC/SanA/YdcF family protein [Streptomyces marincola]UCM91824.1 YdcF family protein [Streptomyces marincola]
MPRTVPGKRRAVQAVMALLVLALLPSAWLHVTTDGRVRDLADAPAAPVTVVFGAGLRPDGEPTQWLANRLDTAAELFHSGRTRAILVTGDNSTEDYNEPDSMRQYLIDRDVPGDRIVADYAGFNTWNSCARARSVFGVTEALLVSQEFHIRRALALCEAAGIDAWGVGVPERMSGVWLFSGVREMAGAVTAAYQAAFDPAPEFAGPREGALDEILAEH